ncbi:hypothetical protein JZ751_026972 [Albula glossodonta]|uniref:NHS-like protein 2 n=1 Tax=Albula glossodonta TaxID=121402 RepID=A0A8T2ND61_9TELE|nr:hypothetical protein JZ751_026972 [Albula glossodonta]
MKAPPVSTLNASLVLFLPRWFPAFPLLSPEVTPPTTNLDSESKRTGHFRSSWQQHVNVLGSWSRPECVQDLHRDAQLNLQRLLQEEFGEQLYDHTATGTTFGQPCPQGQEETSQSQSGAANFHHNGPDQGCLPVSQQGCAEEPAPVGVLGGEFSSRNPDQPRQPPPVPEKPRWLLRPFTPAYLVLTDGTGEGGLNKEASYQRILTLSSETAGRSIPLRRAYSDLTQEEPPSVRSASEMVENMTLLCTSWNGPRDSTFCPFWSESFSPFLLDPGPEAALTPHSPHRPSRVSQAGPGPSVSSGSPSGSFASVTMETSARIQRGVSMAGGGEGRALRADSTWRRQRPVSMPAGSLSSAESLCPGIRKVEDDSLLHPSSGSEEGGSPGAPVSPVSPLEGQTRERSRSISLRKLKKKPQPPERSVSLGKRGDEERAKAHTRPKSLCLPRDLHGSLPPDVILSASQWPNPPDTTPSVAKTAAAGGLDSNIPSQSKSNHRALSTNGATAGTTGTELANAQGIAESLPSPSSSSQNSPSQLSPQSKTSPLKPPQLMSPSSGYSSLSDPPTPVVPTSAVMGPSPLGCRMRPKVPERKSSLQPSTARERATRVRLSCELPLTSHADPPSVKPKPKVNRRHSDSSATISSLVLPKKLAHGQVPMPLVTETDLRNVHLRSISHSEPESGSEGSSHAIQEERSQEIDCSPVRMSSQKIKPPIAAKPHLPKRPLSLVLSTAPSTESPPTSPTDQPRPKPKRPLSMVVNRTPSSESPPTSATPTDQPLPQGNIHKLLRKAKSKKSQAPAPPNQNGAQNPQASDHQQEAGQSERRSLDGSEKRDTNRNLPSRISISCLAELERKQSKMPPPVSRKPSFVLLPVNGIDTGKPGELKGAEVLQDSSDRENTSIRREKVSSVDLQVKAPVTCPEGVELSQDGTEDDYDDVFVSSPAPHPTEDLFAKIHRSKRKVLGRKESSDSFGSRQNLAKAESLNGASKTSSRNNTFMAMLQKKSCRPAPAARLSATEMLQSTKPLARQVIDWPLPDTEPVGCAKTPN